MQIEIEDILRELIRFDRANNDKVKVDRMTRVVANAIKAMERETPCDALRVLMNAEAEGNA